MNGVLNEVFLVNLLSLNFGILIGMVFMRLVEERIKWKPKIT